MKHLFVALTYIVFFLTGSIAQASSDPKFEPPGDWVESAILSQILAENPDSEAVLVILDQQKKLERGKLFSYRDAAIRIDSAKTMSNMMSLFRPVWHPDQGELTVHRYEIIRGSEVIDLTAIEDIFDVIRREKNLERQQVNGMLTAISQVENLQLGDIVRISYTVSKQNRALAGRVQSSGGFVTANVKTDFTRQIVRWPNDMDVKWRGSKEEIVPKISRDDGWTKLSYDYRPKEPKVKIPKNAPARFKRKNYYEVTSFASWKDVSRVNAALYPADDGITKGGELEREILKIRRETSVKKERMALSLRLVQDKIRYLYNGMGFGNYIPQTPEETWRLRYGDCKAKTYLLLAVLRRLGIKVEPMLVNTSQRDAVAERLPSFQAFNHIIVKAELDGKVYWLDGTQNGTRLADMVDTPTHRFGLPSIAEGADLEEIPIGRPGRPYQDVSVTYDVSAGIKLPAPFVLRATLRDRDALKLKNTTNQMSAEKAKELREETALKYVLDGLVTETNFAFDENEETGYLTAKGLSYLSWGLKADQRKHEIWSVADGFKIQKTRDEQELRDLPVRLNYPRYFRYQAIYNLPDRFKAAELKGQSKVNEEIAGYQLSRSVQKNGNQVISKEEYYTGRWELPAQEFELERRKLSRLERKNVEIVLPKKIAGPWQDVEEYLLAGKADAHRDAFDKHVAIAKADDGTAYTNRAYFHKVIGDYDGAIADVEKALEIESDAENHKWLGDLQLGLDPVKAIASYQKATEIKPAYFAALLELSRLHVRRREYQKATAVLEQAKKDGLTDTDADSIHIEILQAEGKFDQAMAIMNGLVEEDPEKSSYLADRCLLRSMEKFELDLALEDCTNAIELAERSAYYHFLRGLAYYQRGEFSLAVLDLDKAIKTSDDQGYIYYLRSAAHRKLEKNLEAEDDLKAAKFFDKYAGWYWGHFID